MHLPFVPQEVLGNLRESTSQLPARSVGVDAVAIARNLVNYIASLGEVPPALVAVIERWLAKFTAKLQHDPKHYLKQ